jgi:vitamin B12 transporter
MARVSGCAYFFIAAFLCVADGESLAAAIPPGDAERIVVVKNKGWRTAYSLDRDTAENLPAASVVEELSYLPVDVQSRSQSAGIQSDFSIRGSNFQQVLMLMDGQRINDPQTGHHNADIPLTREDIGAVQVMPGVSSSLFGPDAIGGAINCVLKKPGERKVVAELSGGNYETAGGLFSASEKLGDAAFRVSLEKDVTGGFRYDTDAKQFIANAASALALPAGEWDTFFGYEDKAFGAYDFYTPGMGFPSREWTHTYLFKSGFDADTGSVRLRPNVVWRRHYDKFMLDQTQVRSTYLNHTRTDLCTPNLYLEGQAGALGKVGAGLEYGEERIKSTNLGKHNRSHESISLDQSDDPGQALFHIFSFRFDNFDSFGNTFTGSAHFYYTADRIHTFKAGATRSMRIPSFTELYYSDPTTIGDPGLEAETATGFETGYEYQKEKTGAGITAFVRNEKEMIDWVKHAASDPQWKAENITRDVVWGVENYAKVDINERIRAEANYTYVGKSTGEKGLLYKYGPNYCAHLFNAFVTFKNSFGDQGVGLTFKKKPGRRGWFLLGANLNRNLTPHCGVFLKAQNILNVEYQEIEGVPQPGREIEAGLRFEW